MCYVFGEANGVCSCVCARHARVDSHDSIAHPWEELRERYINVCRPKSFTSIFVSDKIN